ncbi:MAG TPA: hypothetical protein VMU31_04860 [Rhizomicrobium sp.]|nr:hypothetical protein [Rhizomicrobium sp.]
MRERGETGTPDLGKLPADYVNDDAIIEAEQSSGIHASCTTLMTWLYRLVVPNRWPQS